MAIHLRASERIATPWKNGGGVTYPVAVSPEDADLDTFGWRISIAEIQFAVPFSHFAGVDRVLTVISGAVRLKIGVKPPIILDEASDPFTFGGSEHIESEPIGGSALDLNVMTRAGFKARLSRVTDLNSVGPIGLNQISLVFALLGTYVSIDGHNIALNKFDAIRLAPHEKALSGVGAFVVIEISK